MAIVSKLLTVLKAMPDTWKGSKDELASYLRKHGVKEEELKYSGYLDKLPEGRIDKQTAVRRKGWTKDKFELDELRNEEWYEDALQNPDLMDEDIEALEYGGRAEFGDVLVPGLGQDPNSKYDDAKRYWEEIISFENPDVEISGSLPSSEHFDIDSFPNYLYHMRGTDGDVGTSKNARIMQEIQSDLHGYKQQYGDSPPDPGASDILSPLKDFDIEGDRKGWEKAYNEAYDKLEEYYIDDRDMYDALRFNPSRVDLLDPSEAKWANERIQRLPSVGTQGAKDLPLKKNYIQKGIEQQLNYANPQGQDLVVPLRGSESSNRSPMGLGRGDAPQRNYETKVPSQMKKIAKAQGLEYDEFDELYGIDNITFGRIKADPAKKLKFDKYMMPLAGAGIGLGALGSSEEAEAGPAALAQAMYHAAKGGDVDLAKKILKSDEGLNSLEDQFKKDFDIGWANDDTFRLMTNRLYDDYVEAPKTNTTFDDMDDGWFHGTINNPEHSQPGAPENPWRPFDVGDDDVLPTHLGTEAVAHRVFDSQQKGPWKLNRINEKIARYPGEVTREVRDRFSKQAEEEFYQEAPLTMHKMTPEFDELGEWIGDAGLEDSGAIRESLAGASGTDVNVDNDMTEAAKGFIPYINSVEAPGDVSGIVTPSTKLNYKWGTPVAVGSGSVWASDGSLSGIPDKPYSDRTEEIPELPGEDWDMLNQQGDLAPVEADSFWNEMQGKVAGIPGALASGLVKGGAEALSGLYGGADWLSEQMLGSDSYSKADLRQEQLDKFIEGIENEQERRGYPTWAELLGEFGSPI